jgi:hypothetical protein
MRRSFIVPVLALALTGAGSAFASDGEAHSTLPRSQWLTTAQITEKLAAQGYDVRKIKVEKGAYEVYAIDKDGRRVETYVDPVTGEPIRRERHH